jgi:hypothetical protein
VSGPVDYKPLPDDVREALATAYEEYVERVNAVLDECTDEQLAGFGFDANDVSDAEWKLFDAETRLRYLRLKAITRLARRERMRDAAPILARGGGYCVFHGQDLALCAEEHFKDRT